MDDIVVIGSDKEGITYPKQHLVQKFQKKELGKLWYFLGIEVVQSKGGLVKLQRKYVLDILVDIPMDPSIKLVPRQRELNSNPKRY